MSRALLFIQFFFIFTAQARAVHPATPEMRTKILKQLVEAGKIESGPLFEARRALESELSAISSNKAAIEEARLKVESETIQRDIAYTKAIKLTLVAYGITESRENGLPLMPSGEGVHPSYRSPKITWVVVFSDKKPHAYVATNGKVEINDPRAAEGPHGRVDGMTSGNGVTLIYPGGFASPEDLAYLLYHERVHFDQLTTRGEGDTLGFGEREVAAWRRTHAAVAAIGFPSNRDKERAATFAEQRASYYQAAANQEARLRRLSFNLFNPAKFARPVALSKSEVHAAARISNQADHELGVAVENARREARLSRERAEQEAAAERRRRAEALATPVLAERPSFPRELETTPAAPAERPPLPPGFDGTAPSGAAPAHKPDSTSLLRGVAVEACSSAGARPNGLLTYIHTGMNISSADSERARLSGCELAVFDALTRYARGEYGNFTMSASWLAARAAEHRASAAPVQTQPSGPDCFRGGDPFGCQPR